jgi:hypothetical protein
MTYPRLQNAKASRALDVKASALLSIVFCLSCATPARPGILSQVDAVRQTDAAKEAAALAPQGQAQAEQFRETAEQQWKQGKTASSQIAAERAMAGYDRTRALARIVRAERDLAIAQNQLDESSKALRQLEARQKQVAAEQADLEMQIKVERDAELLASPLPASPAREAARREVARALSTQGRLLCASARLLAATPEPLDAKLKELDVLDEQLAKERVPAPIDIATKLRSDCLHEIVEIRRPKISSNPQGTAGDELFVKLSSAQFTPSRDDRGIAVTLQEPFSGNDLAPVARTALKRLEPIVKEQASIPLLVVVHGAHSNTKRDEARGHAAAVVLRQLGASKTDIRIAGDRLPLLERTTPGAAQRNERLEIVFVIPAT